MAGNVFVSVHAENYAVRISSRKVGDLNKVVFAGKRTVFKKNCLTTILAVKSDLMMIYRTISHADASEDSE